MSWYYKIKTKLCTACDFKSAALNIKQSILDNSGTFNAFIAIISSGSAQLTNSVINLDFVIITLTTNYGSYKFIKANICL